MCTFVCEVMFSNELTRAMGTQRGEERRESERRGLSEGTNSHDKMRHESCCW